MVLPAKPGGLRARRFSFFRKVGSIIFSKEGKLADLVGRMMMGRVVARAVPVLNCIVIGAFLLSGCGGGSEPGDASTGTRDVRLYNWKDFTDKTVLGDFEAETGITVYLNEFKTSEEMIASLQSFPGTQDVAVVEADDLELLRRLRIIEELDPARLAGLAGLKECFQTAPFSGTQGIYGVPYLWGTTGLAVNTTLVPASIDSWNALWDPRYSGRVALLDDSREAMLAVLKSCGYSASTTDPEELRVAEEKALRLKENGVVFGETFENLEKVMSGELWLAEVYSGDVAYLAMDHPEIVYVLPREGYNVWIDCLSICVDAHNFDAAYALIEYFLRPEMSARSAAVFFYGSPVSGTDALIERYGGFGSPAFPSEEVYEEGEQYQGLGEAGKEYERIFQLMQQSGAVE